MRKLLISGKAMGWIEVFLDHGLNGFRDEHRFIFGTRNYFGTRMERI